MATILLYPKIEDIVVDQVVVLEYDLSHDIKVINNFINTPNTIVINIVDGLICLKEIRTKDNNILPLNIMSEVHNLNLKILKPFPYISVSEINEEDTKKKLETIYKCPILKKIVNTYPTPSYM